MHGGASARRLPLAPSVAPGSDSRRPVQSLLPSQPRPPSRTSTKDLIGVSAHPTHAHQTEGPSDPSNSVALSDPAAVLGAVREDIRQTLRMGWVDPAFEALAPHPAFFTAGWSAVRPNVGRSFLSLAKAVREDAALFAKSLVPAPILRDQ